MVDCGSHRLKYGLWRKQRKGGNNAAAANNNGAPQFHEMSSTYTDADGWLDVGRLTEQLQQVALEADVSANQYQLLVALPPLVPQRCREFLTKAAFEVLSVKRVCLGYTPVLSLVGSGATSGLVVDVGHEATTICPVLQATPIPIFTTKLQDQGGRAVRSALRSQMHESSEGGGSAFSQDAEEAILTVAQHRTAIDISYVPEEEWSVTLPDGKTLSNPFHRSQLAAAGQQLTQGTSPILAIHQCLRDVLHAVKSSSSSSVVSNLSSYLLTGGASQTAGYGPTIVAPSVAAACGALGSAPLTKLNCPHPARAAWTGGTILAQLSSFQSMCIDRAVYDECGPRDSLRYISTDIR